MQRPSDEIYINPVVEPSPEAVDELSGAFQVMGALTPAAERHLRIQIDNEQKALMRSGALLQETIPFYAYSIPEEGVPYDPRELPQAETVPRDRVRQNAAHIAMVAAAEIAAAVDDSSKTENIA